VKLRRGASASRLLDNFSSSSSKFHVLWLFMGLEPLQMKLALFFLNVGGHLPGNSTNIPENRNSL
jgi:hypothetical protein